MANTLKIKRSSISGKVPLTTDLQLGELAVNTYDGKLFLKKDVGGVESIVDVSAGIDANGFLTLLKTVDGSGSGLDADLVEGMHAVSTNTVNSIVARDASGNFSAGTITAALSGNASTTTKLATARTISITGDVTGSVSFDGSADASITATIAANSVALGTDTTGNYVADVTAGSYITKSGTAGEGWSPTIAVDATSANTASKVVARDASGNFSAGTITAELSGNASTVTNGVYTTGSYADPAWITSINYSKLTGTIPTWNQNTTGSAAKWTTARTLSFTGDATGSGSVDGSANVATALTLANSGVTAGTYTKITVDAKGRATSGTTLTASDIPSLDAAKITSGVLDAARLPSYVDDVLEYTNLANFPATGETGKIYVALDTNKTYRWSGSAYVYITSGAVDSVAGKTGVVTLTNADVGLGNVENKSSATIRSELTSTNVTTALGFTPYNSTNPNGYTSNTGTVTSVGMTVPTGLSVSGTPITTSGTFAVTLTAGYSIPTTTSQTNWDSAYTQRLQWDGGSTNLVAATGRTSLGGTTVGQNFFTLTNPTAVTFPRINADNTVSALDAATFRTAIGAGTGSGTVTSVTGTAPIASSGGTTPAISLASAYGDTQNPYASKTANYFLAAPNGTAGAPTFRAIVAADIPTLNQNTTGSAATLTTARTINGVSFNGSANINVPHDWVHSNRDFPNGTLIETTIDYSVTNGDPWVLEIRGNSYGNLIPFEIQYQGYIYSDTVINHGGYSVGTSISGLVLFNYNGKLCFWFPNQSYWHGYYVKVYSAYATYPVNKVTSISNLAKPSPVTKEVALSTNIRQVLHSSNYNSYSPTLTGTGASGNWGINVTGSAATLTTARTLTIGSTGKTFNGSADVSWTLAEIGAYAATNPNGYTANTGTVTSVSGTGTASGLTLSGTVTSSGSLTLSGTVNALAAGTYGISISGNAATATTSNRLSTPDTRNTTLLPADLSAGLVTSFQTNTSNGLSDGGTYNGQWSFRQYASGSDTSGGLVHQLGFTDAGNVWHRIGSGGTNTWQSWSKLLDSSNYNSYAPTLTGTGASGTWGISVTGSSASCTGNAATAASAFRAISAGSYGSGEVYGSNGGWSGIRFNTPNSVFMVRDTDSYSGIYKSNSTWVWAFNESGSLVTGTVPWTSVSGRPTAVSSFTNDSGYITSSGSISGYAKYLSGASAYTNGSDGWWRSAGQAGWYNSDYAVGIYATEAGNVRTYNGANFIAAGNLTANSDERLKENWRNLPVDFVEQLAGVKCGIYDRIDTEFAKTQVGVSAQSLQNVMPNAIIEDSEGILSVAYGNAALVSAVELAKEVVSLKAEVTELKNLVANLLNTSKEQ